MATSIHPNCINESITCRANVITPEVGMLGTYFVGSDRYAVVIAKVYTNKKILVLQHCISDELLEQSKIVKNDIEYLPENIVKAMLKMSTPNEKWYDRYDNASDDDKESMLAYDLERFYRENTFTFRKNGRWIAAGDNMWRAGAIHLGYADTYIDPSF